MSVRSENAPAPVGDRPLRILMVQDTPWRRTLGASRVQMEIGEEMQALGHHVEHYSHDEAFTDSTQTRWENWTRPHFSKRAVPWVRANAARFDVVDALTNNLPVTKESLGLQGGLVARSVALYSFYDAFEKRKDVLWPDQRAGSLIGRARIRMMYRRDVRLSERSLRTCDIASMCNAAEGEFVRETLGLTEKTVVLPFGLTRKRCLHFVNAAAPAAERFPRREVVFVGAWTPRKGAFDWAEIIARVRQRTPDARFLFLGTGKDVETIRADIKVPESCDWVRIVPKYDSDELPELIASGTVGAFPSYIEGFPFGILEKLGAGLPTVAYKVPGPVDQLSLVDPTLLTPVGDPSALADRLSELLDPQQADRYAVLSARAREVALQFTWDIIARRTLQLYQAVLSGAATPAAASAPWEPWIGSVA